MTLPVVLYVRRKANRSGRWLGDDGRPASVLLFLVAAGILIAWAGCLNQ